MCGIAGFVDFTSDSSLETLQKMTDTMVHRGPDGSGYEIYNSPFAQIGLGQRRLSIIDLTEGGKQPMSFNNLHLTFNGEIYNFKEIKKELQDIGHSFQSSSDTEMILHAYSEWGIECVHKFVGMFAFVIFDASKSEIYIIRDRAGAKPLFYYWNQGQFLFGSELKAILANPKFYKQIDLDAAASFMQYGYVPTPHCIWKNTHKLKPGHYLKFSLADQQYSISQYWNVYDSYNKPKLNIDFEEAKIETERILKSACDYRMVADVPVGVFLSGGYDSTTVAALLQLDSTEKIKTFTIGVPDAGLNEAPYAKEIAANLGTDHTEYYCTEKEALDIIDDLPFYYDEPFADSSAIPTSLVSKVAKEQVTVALSADAGDEVFAGYNRYHYLSNYGKKIQSIPKLVRNGMASVMENISADSIPILRNKYVFHNRYEKIKNLLRDPSPRRMTLSLSQQYNQNDIQNLFLHNVVGLSTAFESSELKDEYFDDLCFMLAVDYQTYLIDDILQKVDRATMSVSLEGREPLLDHRILEWAAQLPNHFKYKGGEKKYILREINKKYIPHNLMDRPKMGFGIPIERWLSTNLRDLVYYNCNQDLIQKQGIFNPAVTNNLLTSFFSGKKEFGSKVWYLLMFQMWYNRWVS